MQELDVELHEYKTVQFIFCIDQLYKTNLLLFFLVFILFYLEIYFKSLTPTVTF